MIWADGKDHTCIVTGFVGPVARLFICRLTLLRRLNHYLLTVTVDEAAAEAGKGCLELT